MDFKNQTLLSKLLPHQTLARRLEKINYTQNNAPTAVDCNTACFTAVNMSYNIVQFKDSLFQSMMLTEKCMAIFQLQQPG